MDWLGSENFDAISYSRFNPMIPNRVKNLNRLEELQDRADGPSTVVRMTQAAVRLGVVALLYCSCSPSLLQQPLFPIAAAALLYCSWCSSLSQPFLCSCIFHCRAGGSSLIVYHGVHSCFSAAFFIAALSTAGQADHRGTGAGCRGE